MTRALVIAAHGSHYNPGTALPAWRCVDKIRQTGLFDEVTPAFWKEQPSFGTVLDSLQSDDVTVVPLFSSEGYFSQVVLPAELQPRKNQRIKITPAAGSTEYFIPIVANRIEKALANVGISANETAVVIVGHGTSKHNESSTTTEFQAQLVQGRFAEVHTAYLDEQPYIANIYNVVRSANLVVVPFFIAEGLHTQDDIPRALGLSEPLYEPQIVQNRRVLYTPPVGLEDDLFQVVLALADVLEFPVTDAIYRVPTAGQPVGTAYMLSALPGINSRASTGQISLIHESYLCHIDDIDNPDLEILETPEAIRAKLRFTDEGKFRPLATSTDLPHGWKILTPDAAHRAAALQMIYPGVLKVESTRSLQEVGLRQKGKYRPVVNLTSEKIEFLTQKVCTGCVRHPSWHDGNTEIVPGCIEPCSIFLEEAIQ